MPPEEQTFAETACDACDTATSMRLSIVIIMLTARVAAAEHAFPFLDHVLVKDVTATSTLADKKNAYAPKVALAYDLRSSKDMSAPAVLWSAWCEGKPDEGIGEGITITLGEATQIEKVRIAPGVWRTKKLFDANNRITELEVIADGKSQKVKGGEWNDWVEATVNAKVKTVVVKISGVTKGKMNDSCIAGIDLSVGDRRLTPIIGYDPTQFAALVPSLVTIQKALADPDKKGLESLIEFPFSAADSEAFSSGFGGSSVRSANWAALVKRCKDYKAKSDKAGDDMIDPKGCPQPANFDPDDDRPSSITVGKPGFLSVQWNSHKDTGYQWELHWDKDKWKLRGIGLASYGPP